MAIPVLFFRPPKFPTVEFTQDSVVTQAEGIGSQAAKAFQKQNAELYHSWKMGRSFTATGLVFLILSLVFQLAASALR